MFAAEDEEDLFAALPAALREALEFGSAPVERDRESEVLWIGRTDRLGGARSG